MLVPLSRVTLKSLGPISDQHDDLIIQCKYPNTIKKATKNIFFQDPCHLMQVIKYVSHLMQSHAVQSSYTHTHARSPNTNACSRNLSIHLPLKQSTQRLKTILKILTVFADSHPLRPFPGFLSSCSQPWEAPTLPQGASAVDSSTPLRSSASTLHTQAHCTD